MKAESPNWIVVKGLLYPQYDSGKAKFDSDKGTPISENDSGKAKLDTDKGTPISAI